MATAGSLITPRVAIGTAEERLKDLGERITRQRAHYCVVVDLDSRTFLGLVRLAELAGQNCAPTRILADLVFAANPLRIRETESAKEVVHLLRQHDVDVAVVLNERDHFVGLITPESVLAWLQIEVPSTGDAARPETTSSATPLPSPSSSRSVSSRTPTPRASKSADDPRVVLLVEDHQASREALAAFLKRRDYRVLQAGSAQDALELANRHPIDLVVSDIGLPDSDGRNLMDQLRREHGLNGLAVSAYGSTDDIAKSKAAGFVAHLAKPVVPEALEKTLEHYFAMERAAATTARPG